VRKNLRNTQRSFEGKIINAGMTSFSNEEWEQIYAWVDNYESNQSTQNDNQESYSETSSSVATCQNSTKRKFPSSGQNDAQSKRQRVSAQATQEMLQSQPRTQPQSQHQSQFHPQLQPQYQSQPQSRQHGSPSLPDYLVKGLNLVMVGDNPGIQSASKQRWYSHPTNHFWPLLHESGILPVKLEPSRDYEITKFGVGLTCLCKEVSRTTSEIDNQKWKNGFHELKQKLLIYKPKAVCFNGKGIYDTIFQKKLHSWSPTTHNS